MASHSLANLSSLPSELLIKICQELSRSDLKSLRLTRSVLSTVAAQVLYSTVYLTTSLKSLQSFLQISENSVLRLYVKTLDYDPRTICSCEFEPPTIDSYEDWWEDHAGNFEPLDKWNRMTLLDAYPESKLKSHYMRWLEYLEDEKRFRSTEYPQRILPGILSNCPNLTSITQPSILRRSRDLKPGVEYENLEAFLADNRFAQETLSGKTIVFNSISQPKPWDALKALHLADRLTSLSVFDGVDLHLHSNQDDPLRWELPALRKLGIIIVHKDICRASTFTRLLSSCPGLQELKIVYRGHLFLQQDRRDLQLSHVLSNTLHWAGLRKLSLEHLRMTGPELQSLLTRHASSLKSLELHSIRLDPEVNTKGEEQTTSWLDMIEYLLHNLFLTNVQFSGLLANGRNEAWRVGELLLADTLKWRIQAYICRKGDDPIKRDLSRVFEPIQDVVEFDTRCREVPFIFDDETWSFAPAGLPQVSDFW